MQEEEYALEVGTASSEKKNIFNCFDFFIRVKRDIMLVVTSNAYCFVKQQ